MLTYNNTKIETLKFGSTDIETGIFNGVTVFEKGKENTAVLRTTQQKINLEIVTNKGLDVDVWNAGEKVAVFKSGANTTVTLKNTGQDVIIKGRDIVKLICYDNELTSLNVQGLTALQTLYCYNNQLTSLNAQGLTALQTLYCYNNQLTSLNVQGLTNLQWLSCYDNQLTSLNVQGSTALQTLYCYNNQLTSLNAQGLTALYTLSCYDNQLTASAFKDIFINLAKIKWGGKSILYKDRDSNYKDFTQPPELARAFNAAKEKGWKFYKNSQNNENLL